MGNLKYDKDDIVTLEWMQQLRLRPGLKFVLNGQEIEQPGGLADLVKDELKSTALYEPFRMKTKTMEIIFTHTNRYNDEFHTFVNGQYTTDGGIQGGTHKGAERV